MQHDKKFSKRYHNKRRNAALLNEFLIRHISKCLIENNRDEAQKTVDILKKYFFKDKPLHKELSLFKMIVENRVASRESASKLLKEVCFLASKMNVRELDSEKSLLIKDINHILKSDNIFEYKIPNYSIYASVQTLLNEERNKNKILNPVDKIKLEDVVVENLIKEDKENKIIFDPKFNNAVYKFVIQKFHDKYSNILSENQRKFLTKYVVYLISENKAILQSTIKKEIITIKESLRSVKDQNLQKDSDLIKKINECYKKFVSTNFENINDDTIKELLQYMKLSEEMQ